MTRTIAAAMVCTALLVAAPTVARDVAPPTDISIRDAIWGAATDPERGVFGRFRMKVVETGRQDGTIYLNSERDYRDQRNLSVDIPAKVQKQLVTIYGTDADRALRGRTILVTGVAQRVKIAFYGDKGQLTSKYYYQTHVVIVDPRQIQLAE